MGQNDGVVVQLALPLYNDPTPSACLWGFDGQIPSGKQPAATLVRETAGTAAEFSIGRHRRKLK